MADPRSASLVTQPQTPAILAPFGFGPSTRRPTNPAPGFLYYDTTLALEVVYTGASWKVVGVQPVPVVGYGTTVQRPTSPQPGFLYFDTTLQQLFAWAGANWVAIGPSAVSVQMVGYGATGARPASPPNGFLYFDTTLQQEIVWKGTAWLPIGPSESGSAPVITSPSNVNATQNAPFSYQITATNTPISFGESGSLPAGLSLNTGTGVISGTPSVAGSTSITISATNGTGTGSAPLTITVGVPSANPVITSATSASATQNQPFTYQITATNSPTAFNVIGSLPSGLSVNTSTGLISGTPAVSGTFNVSVTATNGTGTGSGPLALNVTAGAVAGGRWRFTGGVGVVSPSFPAFVGATVDSAATSTFTVIIRVQTGGQFPPGVNYQFVSPSGVVLQSGTTAGGEDNINFSMSVSTEGGYSVVVSTSSATFVVGIDTYISGTARFRNGSYRGLVLGPILSPPGGNGIALIIHEIDAATKLAIGEYTEGTTNVLRQPPFYTWNFDGDTTNNPKTDWNAGLTNIQLFGSAGAAIGSDSRLEVSG